MGPTHDRFGPMKRSFSPFSSVWTDRVYAALVPVKETLKVSAYQDILDNFMFPTFPFLFQHDCAPVYKARFIKTDERVWGGGT